MDASDSCHDDQDRSRLHKKSGYPSAWYSAKRRYSDFEERPRRFGSSEDRRYAQNSIESLS